MTSTTRIDASKMVIVTSRIEARMKVEESKAISSFTPGGSSGSRETASARTASATSSVFAFDCFTTPRPIAGTPLKRTCLRTSCGPTSMRATSLSFTAWPLTLAMIMFSKSDTLRSSPRLRTVNSASFDSRRPDGMSTFSR